MPAVGMRRTTRVFGVVKRGEGARVLRSGRRIWPDVREVKLRRVSDREEWYRLMKNNGNGHKPVKGGDDVPSYKPYGSAREQADPKEEETNNEDGENEEDDSSVKKRQRVGTEALGDRKSEDQVFRVVYRRKRLRHDEQKYNILPKSADKMYGIKYSRRVRRKNEQGDGGILVGLVIASVLDGSLSRAMFFECVLRSVLVYMRKTRLSASRLAGFLLSQPIRGVYSSHGICFLQEAPTDAKGICKFFISTGQLLPLFSVDYTAVPLCFMHMHQALLLRVELQSFAFVNKSIYLLSNGKMISTSEECQLVEESENDSEKLVSVICRSRSKEMPHQSVGLSKLTGRHSQQRNGLSSRGIRKRRSSFRRRRARHVSLGVNKFSESLSTEVVGCKKNGVSLSSVVSQYKLRSASRDNSCAKLKEMSSADLELKQDMGSLSCFVNILATESDRCYREEGAAVMLELSSSGDWLLVVKKDGSIRYTHKAQFIMRPCSSNRVTHAIMWTADDTWKLEFCNRQDWSIFKDLYRECSKRNTSVSNVKVIPVPGVSEVSGYKTGSNASFCRPVAYISIKDDEISRAMAKSSAIYDMDSEDEEWLKKFNAECVTENDPEQRLSEDNFELMIDGLEKAHFYNHEDFSEEKAASSLCHLGKREMVEAVYSYWMKKRKQRKTSLLRVFQGHQGKKEPVVLKPLLRKKRSFKRQASQHFGRGKQTSLLQAMAAEKHAQEEHNALLRLEEAKATANLLVEAAIVKRQRAQVLMENADLAMYKAMMALRIAEAARMAESVEFDASRFLDLDGASNIPGAD